MSKNDAWMPLYIGDYLADTMHLDGAAHGAYLLLLMHYWRNGPLADDDRVLAGIARTDRKAWSRDVGPAVRPFFTAQDGRLHQKRMDAERAKADAVSGKRKAAADARWAGKTEQSASKTDANASAHAQQMDTHAGARPSASPSQSQSQEENPPTPRKRGAVSGKPPAVVQAVDLPPWLPPAVWDAWCRYRRGPKWTADAQALSLRELAKFHANGHDPRVVIEQSIAAGWTGLFAPKASGRGGAPADRRSWVMQPDGDPNPDAWRAHAGPIIDGDLQ